MLFPRAWLSVLIALQLGACATGGDRSDLGLRVGAAELGAGAAAAALQTAQGLSAARPDDPRRLVLLGQAYMASGRLQVAETTFQRALVLDPGSFDAEFGLARLHTLTDPGAALDALRRLSARHPENPAILTDLGVACDLDGRSQEAQGFYRRALVLDPSLVSAQVDLGLSLALSGHPDQGVQLLGPIAGGADGSPRIRADYAVAASLNGDPATAAAVLNHDLCPEQTRSALAAYKALGHAGP